MKSEGKWEPQIVVGRLATVFLVAGVLMAVAGYLLRAYEIVGPDVEAGANFAALFCVLLSLAWRALLGAARRGAGAEVRRYLDRAAELGVPLEERKGFCWGMRDAKRAVDRRGYCEARREDGIAARGVVSSFDRGFRQWLDDFATGMPAAPAGCVGVVKWEGCRTCPWARGPQIVGNPGGDSRVRDAMQQGEGE